LEDFLVDNKALAWLVSGGGQDGFARQFRPVHTLGQPDSNAVVDPEIAARFEAMRLKQVARSSSSTPEPLVDALHTDDPRQKLHPDISQRDLEQMIRRVIHADAPPDLALLRLVHGGRRRRPADQLKAPVERFNARWHKPDCTHDGHRRIDVAFQPQPEFKSEIANTKPRTLAEKQFYQATQREESAIDLVRDVGAKRAAQIIVTNFKLLNELRSLKSVEDFFKNGYALGEVAGIEDRCILKLLGSGLCLVYRPSYKTTTDTLGATVKLPEVAVVELYKNSKNEIQLRPPNGEKKIYYSCVDPKMWQTIVNCNALTPSIAVNYLLAGENPAFPI